MLLIVISAARVKPCLLDIVSAMTVPRRIQQFCLTSMRIAENYSANAREYSSDKFSGLAGTFTFLKEFKLIHLGLSGSTSEYFLLQTCGPGETLKQTTVR